MQEVIAVKVKTLSNLFIGGAPTSFEIGGIDQQTVVDHQGFPYIPGSSLKGALRAIVQQDKGEPAQKIAALFAQYLKEQEEKNKQTVRSLVQEQEALDRIETRYREAKALYSAVHLFGIKGFNNTPKLLFGDLYLCESDRQQNACFSIDMKNSIENTDDGPSSNPRSYRTARSGLIFEGEIRLHGIEQLGKGAIDLCSDYICDRLRLFNEGLYRLGNSKSRGYGRVEIWTNGESEAG